MLDVEKYRRFERMRCDIPQFWYLEERGWFHSNHALQNKVWQLVNYGQGHLVQVACGDFEEHIDNLLARWEESKSVLDEPESVLSGTESVQASKTPF